MVYLENSPAKKCKSAGLQQRFSPTSSIIQVFGIASFQRAVPVAGVVSPPAHHPKALLSSFLHPRGTKPPSTSPFFLKHPTHEAKSPSVRWSPAAHLRSYKRVSATSGSGTIVPDEARVQKNEAPGGQVEEDEGEESHRFPAEVALYLQQRLGHAGSPSHSETLAQWWKIIKMKSQHHTQPHWAPAKAKIKVSEKVLILYEGHPKNNMSFPLWINLQPHKEGCLHLCCSAGCENLFLLPLTVLPWQPALGPRPERWVAPGERWSLKRCFHFSYQPTEMPHQHRSGTFSHTVRREEGFIYQLSWDPFSSVRPAIHWDDPGEKGRDSPSAVKTHTHTHGE